MRWEKGARRPRGSTAKGCRDPDCRATTQKRSEKGTDASPRRAGEQRSRQGSNLRGDPNGFRVHRLNLSATTTPACGAPALLAAGGQHRTPPSVRHKIHLKDEVAKGARRPVARRQKAAVTRIAAPQRRVLTTIRSGRHCPTAAKRASVGRPQWISSPSP
ncbi:hypothetical protein G5714_020145 [Onychostoma macrolepis]|uniref:Uncharacterized protein n=1 Tax=Onychostoma macrolepis TaxID=369639 RepID=A0A7J6BYF0_9TELE|nr:hypothetical protein G5714_020145 [Onychostoma macrolepis]